MARHGGAAGDTADGRFAAGDLAKGANARGVISRAAAWLGSVAALPAWIVDAARKALHRRLQFATFGEALAAMVRIGIEADKADHHPEWLNVYGTIDIWLTPHDVGGISERDVALASVIHAIFPAGSPS